MVCIASGGRRGYRARPGAVDDPRWPHGPGSPQAPAAWTLCWLWILGQKKNCFLPHVWGISIGRLRKSDKVLRQLHKLHQRSSGTSRGACDLINMTLGVKWGQIYQKYHTLHPSLVWLSAGHTHGCLRAGCECLTALRRPSDVRNHATR